MKVLKEKEIVNNIYLEILCETGVFGFIFFGLFLWEMFAVCRQLPLKTLSFAFWVILLIWFGFPSFSLMFQWAFFGGLIGLITFGQQAESAREHGIA
jgi:O-antigen ligase